MCLCWLLEIDIKKITCTGEYGQWWRETGLRGEVVGGGGGRVVRTESIDGKERI